MPGSSGALAQARNFFERRDFAACLEIFEGLQREGLSDDALSIKAQCFYYLERAHEAAAIAGALLEKDPGNPSYRLALSLYLRALGEFDTSEAMLRGVPKETPGWAMLAGWHALRHGGFLEGSRIRERELGIRRIDDILPLPHKERMPRSAPVAGKRVLLALEGGNGDEVAYARFAQVLKARGALVTALASPDMRPLIARMTAVDDAFAPASGPMQFDYYLPSMSAPDLLDITDPLEGISFPYLTPDPAWVARWKPLVEKEAGGRKKIGIQWQGNTQFAWSEFKTIPAALLAPLAPFGALFAIQRTEDLGGNVLPVPAFDTQKEKPDWESTAAVISLMDVIVTGDTTIAHLAGAMGKKVLLLLPHAPHPYWADLKETSSWYPSITVCRQPSYADWPGAVSAAIETLSV